jgi:hypothetical protein
MQDTDEIREKGHKYHLKLKMLMQNTPEDVPMLTPPTSNEDVEILGIYARLPDRTGKQSTDSTSIDKQTKSDINDISNFELWIRLTSHIGLLKYHSPIAIRMRYLNDALMCFKPETQRFIAAYTKKYMKPIREHHNRIRRSMLHEQGVIGSLARW